ncbi:hypothetical protein [Pelosinus sp. UFO1]|uniref:hypothetical protein n=1 Tax=Pelosinus sp. UFO1 TaxID=484770 RepID=UPI0004D18238|nr:hypothetical protein [Pelosinus sp. UFO1]AIF52881.1 hypothetical protein UFO1_3338 [Pelosinus sp. UFO1]
MLIQSQWINPEECDVKNIARLREFRLILSRWKTILAGNDPHSVREQLTQIAWDDAIYWSLNEGLGINERRTKPLPLPASLVELIHDRYFQSQVLLFRRLFERKATKPKDEVYSLCTVLEEMKKHSNLIVRETYVCYDGTPYEVENCKHDWRIESQCSHRHRVFDTLCQPFSGERNREDELNTSIIQLCEKEISDLLQRLKYYSNKYIAHASDMSNRKPAEIEPPLLSLGYLQDLHENAICLSQTIGKIADELVLAEVPTPIFDQFKGWEHFFDKEIKAELYEIWRNRVALIRGWTRMYWESDTLHLPASKESLT